MLTKYCAGAVGLAMILNASAASAAIFSDNFNSAADSSEITGRTSDTGQVWTNLTLFGAAGTLHANPVYGSNGTNVAGGIPGGGNSVDIGSPITTGTVTLQLDFDNSPSVEGPGSNIPQFWLSSATASANASLQWRADTGFLGWEGLGVAAFSVDTDLSGTSSSLLRLHVTLNVNLDAKQFQFSWFDPTDPSDPNTTGSSSLMSYSPVYEPEIFHMYRNTGNGASYSGFDNIEIVPEPASLGALSLPGLVAFARRRTR